MGPEIPRTPDEALLEVDHSRTNDLHEKNMRIEEVIPETEIVRTREELSPATPTGGMFQSLEQQIWTIRRVILGSH